jgi:tetratricopeptide (TPR) repeat protein
MARSTARSGIVSRLKNIVSGLFSSEAEKHYERGLTLSIFHYEAGISSLEEALSLEPNNEKYVSTLARLYSGAADERVGLIGWGGVLQGLRSSDLDLGRLRAETILSWVRKIKQPVESDMVGYSEAYKGLNDALDGCLYMYDQSISIAPDIPIGHARRAHCWHRLAETILMTWGLTYTYIQAN